MEVLGVRRETIEWLLLPAYARHQWDGTADPIADIFRGLVAGQSVGVEAGTGTQKSFTAACALLWFLGCWEGARVFTFAPKEEQLRLFTWAEVNKLWPKFREAYPTALLTDLRIRMRGERDDSWGAFGYAVGVKVGEQSATKAQGMHAEHMLLMYDETPGQPLAVLEAGVNTCTAPHNLRLYLGNPDHQLDTLHQACVAPGVRHIRLSALDHPNVVTGETIVPGAVGPESIARRLARYGAASRIYQSRVRGVSPAEAAESLIRLEWVRAAQARWLAAAPVQPLPGPAETALGVDVANSEDGDQACVTTFRGRRVTYIEEFPCPNANDLGTAIAVRMRDEEILPEHVGVDSIGVGAGTVNELKARDYYVQGLNGGAKALEDIEEERFLNLRGQMAWRLREDLRLDLIDLPPDPREAPMETTVAFQLTMPQWEPRNGKIVVESKEDIKARTPGGKSPNKFDALMYGNFVRPRRPEVQTPTGALTVAQRIAKEFRELDEDAAHAAAGHSDTYAGVLRQ